MDTAGQVFLQSLTASTGKPPGDVPDLERRLDVAIAEIHRQGSEVWRPVQLALEDFARHLGVCVAGASPGPGPLDALAALHGTDLYLACAAGRGLAGAGPLLVQKILGPVAGVVRALKSDQAFVDEVGQCLQTRLLVGESGPPRILRYLGRSALATWIGVAAQRIAIDLLRADASLRRAADRVADEPLAIALDPELQYLRARYGEAFKAAVTEAIGRLPVRQRTVLRLHSVAGLSLAKIAIVLAVDESTVSRWAQRARTSILADTHRELGARLGLRVEEVPSLVRLVTSQIDLSIARLLGAGETEVKDSR